MSNTINPIYIAKAPAAQKQSQATRSTSRKGDTIAPATPIGGFVTASQGRPKLPTPAPSKDPDYLMIVAGAFSRTFQAMSGTLQSQAAEYAQVQQLNQTMAKCVLLSTTNSVTKEQNELKVQEQLAKYQKEMGGVLEVFNIVTLTVTVLAGVAAVLASDGAAAGVGEWLVSAGRGLCSKAADAFSTDAVAEAEGAAGESAAGVAGEDGGIEMQTFSMTMGEEGTLDTASEISESSEISEVDEVEQEAENTTETVSKSDEAESSSKTRMKKVGKQLFKFGTGVLINSTQLVSGASYLKQSSADNKVAAALALVGPALSKLEKSNMYFQYYQQLLSRGGQVLQGLSNLLAEVIETYGQLVNTYQQIPQGLASAV